MLSVLEGMVADGRIRKAKILFEQIKHTLPLNVRIMCVQAIEERIKNIIANKERRSKEEKQLEIVECRKAIDALFRKE